MESRPVNKGLEAVYKLAMKKKFRREIETARIEIGIPIEGYKNENDERISHFTAPTTYLQTGSLDLEKVSNKSIEILHKYHLPPTYWAEMAEYIRYGIFHEAKDTSSTTATIEFQGKSNAEKIYKQVKQPYVKIYILDATSKEKVFDIISKNWGRIKEELVYQGGDLSKVKKSENKDRNYLMSLLNAKPRAELLAMLPPDSARMISKESKSFIVAKIMKEIYGYKKVTDDMVRKYPNLSKKSTDKPLLKRSREK